ncbi:MAG: T9SS type A sorting domain-containing protein [Flavobacterium sp.]|uniref:T9SS type A sorting domain-containing protein n=1 Tax=Flavobacterium sp. TaxID=239 RepID=UPI003264D0D5
MKKITLLFFLMGTVSWVNAQVLNQNAGWPNATWTLTGSYLATGLQSNPTLAANFAFDDDITGSGHEDNIAVESPVINLTPAFTAGETWLTVSAPYVYRYLANDELVFQYWNAGTSTWVNWGTNFDALGNYTANTNYCSGTPSTYTSVVLNIAGFTPTQLSGFKYRIAYDDDPLGIDWNYGFCFQSPTIVSATPPSCPAPTALAAVPTVTSATLSWTENGSATLYNVEYGANGFTPGTGTLLSGISNSYTLTPLNSNTAYSYYVQAACSVSSTSAWVGPFNFSTLYPAPANDECSGSIGLTVNPDFACADTTAGTTQGGTQSMAATPCFGTPNDDVWYRFTATATSHRIVLSNVVAVGAGGTSTDAYMQVLSGACGSQTSVLCSDPNTATPTGLTIGDTYYVRVYTYGTTNNITFNICVGTPPPPPANDECTGAIALTVNPDYNCGTVTAGTVQSATASSTDATACFGAEDDDVWYSFVATNTTHSISLTNVAGSVTDMFHSLWTGADCASLTLVPGTCSDPNISAPTGLTIGQTYYVRVNTYTATGGQNTTFNICIGTPPPPPANDECTGAVALTVNADLACGTVTAGTVAGATASATDATACFGAEDDDVWYSFVATNTTHRISLTGVAGSTTDMFHSLWTGNCATLTLVPGSCSDGDTSNPAGLTIGQTYFIRVNTYTSTGGQTSTFNVCVGTLPPPPANDECTNAISLTAGGVYGEFLTDGTNGGATTSSQTAPATCGGFSGGDVWYTVTVPASGNLTIETGDSSTGATGLDTVVTVYSGDCSSLVQVGCDDDGAATGAYSFVSLTGQTPSSTLYLRVYEYSNDNSGSFGISAYDASLGNNSFDPSNFSYYPNPVKDVLNLSYNQEISSVEVFNLLGQKVITNKINANVAHVDMSNLAKGAYMVRVTSNDQVKTIKVVKE